MKVIAGVAIVVATLVGGPARAESVEASAMEAVAFVRNMAVRDEVADIEPSIRDALLVSVLVGIQNLAVFRNDRVTTDCARAVLERRKQLLVNPGAVTHTGALAVYRCAIRQGL